VQAVVRLNAASVVVVGTAASTDAAAAVGVEEVVAA